MKKVYIMRGLPYSGKSTRARELAGENGRVHSANDYFMVNGKYRYDSRQIRTAHEENLEKFKKSLEERVPIVILDNCHVKIWEFQDPAKMAEDFGYEVEIVIMPHAPAFTAWREVNWRNIPREKFLLMHSNFEDFRFRSPVKTSV